jgi:protein arginine kinase activator
MRCENCGERDAVIHLTQIVNNSVTTTHLCEPCAAEKGVETGASVAKFPLGDFLASLGKGGAPEQAEGGVDVPCAWCGATLKDFRQTGRLGCARCYESFAGSLRDLLRRLHGNARHVGEQYRPVLALATGGASDAGPGSPVRELDQLREHLRRAVAEEDFERAAELRDRIRALE